MIQNLTFFIGFLGKKLCHAGLNLKSAHIWWNRNKIDTLRSRKGK